MPLSFAIEDKGILPDRMIAALARDGGILPAAEFAPDQIQPASLDLRLGDVAYRRGHHDDAVAAYRKAVELEPARVYTNILVFRLRAERVPGDAAVAPAQRFVAGMKDRGVLLGAFGATDVRMVTHYEIGDADVDSTLKAARDVLG